MVVSRLVVIRVSRGAVGCLAGGPGPHNKLKGSESGSPPSCWASPLVHSDPSLLLLGGRLPGARSTSKGLNLFH